MQQNMHFDAASILTGYYEQLYRLADLNEAVGAADATRELDGSVCAVRLK